MIVDCLVSSAMMPKAQRLIEAVYEGALGAGIDARIIRGGKPRDGAYVVLYGLGGPDRIGYAGQPNVISFDAGYWERKLDPAQRKYRVSIGGFHCPQRIFNGPNPGPERWESSGLTIAEKGGNPDGPILLVGNGPKSNRIGAANWCAEMSRNLRKWFPGKTIWYRPKPKRAHDVGVEYDGLADGKDIDKVLSQCSLVVCRHSNVAVDAARCGVPTACEDGAARAIYPEPWMLADKTLQGGAPLNGDVGVGLREIFLSRLAWWQWSVNEIKAGKFWPWMQQELQR